MTTNQRPNWNSFLDQLSAEYGPELGTRLVEAIKRELARHPEVDPQVAFEKIVLKFERDLPKEDTPHD